MSQAEISQIRPCPRPSQGKLYPKCFFLALIWNRVYLKQPLCRRTDPVHRSSHTRWGLGRDYRNLVLPLQSAMQRGWFEPRTSWHKWGGLHHCARPALLKQPLCRLMINVIIILPKQMKQFTCVDCSKMYLLMFSTLL